MGATALVRSNGQPVGLQPQPLMTLAETPGVAHVESEPAHGAVRRRMAGVWSSAIGTSPW